MLRPPEKFSPTFDLSGFECGEASLDDWLRKRAAQNEASGTSRTYVVRDGDSIAGYYSLAVGAITHDEAPGRIKRNAPNSIPAMVLGRLAVDRRYQAHGLGSALLRDAILRTVQAAEIAGIRALLVHVLNERAFRFYEKHGFIASPVHPLTVMISVADARPIVEGW